jgi:hypothetical protein
MHLFSQKALALDKLLILLVAVSVVSTGVWNVQVRRAAGWAETSAGAMGEDGASKAMEVIRYHVQLAGYKLDRDIEPLTVDKGRKSDRLRVCYNDITAEFFVDRGHNLICRVGENEKTLASGMASLRTVILSPASVVITLTPLPSDRTASGDPEETSRSYSAAIEIPWLL